MSLPSTTSPSSSAPSAPPPGPTLRGASRMRSRTRSPRSSFRPNGSAGNTASSITKDRDMFEQCTDDHHPPGRRIIGRMVDEFSAFARMPKPVMELHDLRDVVQEPVVLFQRGPAGDQLRARSARQAGDRCSFDRRLLTAGRHQPRQECQRGDRNGAEAEPRPRRLKGHVESHGAPQGRPRAHRGDRQRQSDCPSRTAQRLLEPYVDHARQRAPVLDLRSCRRSPSSMAARLPLEDAPQAERHAARRARAHRPCRSDETRHEVSCRPKCRTANGAQQQATAPEAGRVDRRSNHGC